MEFPKEFQCEIVRYKCLLTLGSDLVAALFTCQIASDETFFKIHLDKPDKV